MCERTRNSIHRPVLLICRALLAASCLLCATVKWPTPAFAEGLTLSANFTEQTAVAPSEKIGLQLNRPLQAADGTLAIFIGPTDMTALFAVQETSLRYTSDLPLPAGQSDVIVYLVSTAEQWKEVARFPLRVSANTASQPATASPPSPTDAPANGNRLRLTPSLTVAVKAQAAEAHFPDSNRPARTQFTDLSLQGSLTAAAGDGALGFQSQFDVAGSSFRGEALRFAQEGDEAPRFDLASYLMQFQAGKSKIQVGHLAFSSNRHLINSFASRGISITLPVSSRGDFSLAAMNGTNLVGWANFIGLNRRKHQVFTGTLGVELIGDRPGGLRIEGGALHGSLLPISNFNQGNLTDAEQSRGGSLRLLASDPAGRFKLDGGFARSRFTNPADPLLEQGFNSVSVRETARNARYFEASYEVLRDVTISDTQKAGLTVNYRHEMVDPLFRSVAAYHQADRLHNQVELVAHIAEVTATVAHLRFHDNLDNLASILKTNTRKSSLLVGAPLAALFSRTSDSSEWWPRVGYGVDRTHQVGDGLPLNSGFTSLSQVPDQVSSNQTALAEWQVRSLRFGYRFNRSFQDNRQLGRELADLRNLIQVFTVGLTPLSMVDVSFDVNLERAKNFETQRTDRANRLGGQVNWRMSGRATLAATVSAVFAGDTKQISRNRNAEVDLQWSYRFGWERSRYQKVQGQFFVRYANRYASLSDTLFGLSNRTKLQTLNTGLSFTFF